jgi:hypothetical protein
MLNCSLAAGFAAEVSMPCPGTTSATLFVVNSSIMLARCEKASTQPMQLEADYNIHISPANRLHWPVKSHEGRLHAWNVSQKWGGKVRTADLQFFRLN